MLKRFSTICLLLFLLRVVAFATPDSSLLLHYNIANGLPSNNVYSLMEDHMGYLWFATDNGVARYNGYSFKNYNTRKGLPSNDVFMLYEDAVGRVWLHTMAYKYGYIQNGTYTPLAYNAKETVFNIHQVASSGNYLFFTFLKNNCMNLGLVQNDYLFSVPLFFLYGKSEDASAGFVNFALITPNCKLWAFGYEGEIYSYDLLRPYEKYKKTGVFDDAFPTHSVVSRNGNSRAYITNTGYMALAEFKSNMLMLTNMNNRTYKYLYFNNVPGEYIYTSYPGDRIHDKDKKNTIITNTYAYTYDSNFNFVRREELHKFIPASTQVAYVLADHFANNWYTTTSQGAFYKIKLPAVLATDEQYRGMSSAKYIGHSLKGSTYWWDKNAAVLHELTARGSISHIPFPSNTNINSIAPISDSFNYMAFIDGIYRYNTYTKRLLNITETGESICYLKSTPQVMNENNKRSYLSNHFSLAVYSDSDFFTTGPVGVNHFRQYKDSLVIRRIDEERYSSLFHDTIRNIIWAYNQQKIFLYNPEKKQHITFAPDRLLAAGIRNISNIELDRFGNVYVSDDQKILVYNTFSHSLINFHHNFNFANASFHISGDKIVVAAKFGLAIARIQDSLRLTKFNILPNVNYVYYNRVFDFAVTDSAVLLNTDKGFYRFNTADLEKQSVYLDSGNPDFFRLLLKYPAEKRIKQGDTIRVDQGTEKIEFDVVNYYGKGSPVYKYYISGYSAEWQQSDGEILLGKLSAGKCYRVTCVASDDMWQSEPRIFYIYRTPYWWQTTRWSVLIWVTGIGSFLTIILFVIFFTRRAVARNNEKKRLLTELELKAVYAQINPHFIFNTLSGALYFINKKRFNDAHVHVSKFSNLLRSYIKSSQDRYVLLDEEIQMLTNYIELQQIRFEEKFEHTLVVDSKVQAKNILIPSLLLQPLVENAINHGLFHLAGGGRLLLSFLRGANDYELICIIEDNGVGRAKAKDINRQNNPKHESYGTRLTQQLIDTFKEYEHIHIQLEYTDKTLPQTGTIVTLTIKNLRYVE